MKIPEAIRKEAQELIAQFGDRLSYLGKIADGRDAYSFTFPDDQEVGFPSVFLYDGHVVMEISGFDALDIINSLNVE